jgi:hypothetical protein
MADNIFQRYEIKYLVTRQQREEIEKALEGRMFPDEYGYSMICNVYYDTPDFRLIRKSLEKPVYKEKLRHRSYGQVGEDGRTYIELKKKYQGIVYKRRISMPEQEAAEYLQGDKPLKKQSQIAREIDYFRSFYQKLIPRMYICYERIAYYCEADSGLRITFDTDIKWRLDELSLKAAPGGQDILEPGQSLMEVKTAGAIPMWLVNVLNREEIRQTSFSKYGLAYITMINSQKEEEKAC